MAERSSSPGRSRAHMGRSLAAVVVGTLLLRAAAGAMGVNIQFYFNQIDEAARNPASPLRAIVGLAHVYPVSYTLRGIIIGTFFAAELLASPVFGAWSDRTRRKPFIVLGPLFGVLAVAVTSVTTIVGLLVLTRLLEGLSTASNAPATLGYLAETTAHSQKLRTRVVGLFEVATIGGMAAGFSLGGWLFQHFGVARVIAGVPLTSPAFALNALAYVASFVVFWLGVHDLREARREGETVSQASTWAHYWKVVSNPRVAGFAPAWIAINAVLGAFINHGAGLLTATGRFPGQLLVGRFDSFQAGNVFAGYAVVFVVGILLWSLVSPSLRKTSIMLAGTVGLLATCALLLALNHQPALSAPLVAPLAVLLGMSILVQSGFTPAALTHLANITEDHGADRGAIMGLYSVFLGLGQFLGASVGGPFVDRLGLDGLILLIALLGVFSGLMVWRLRAADHDRMSERGPAPSPPGQ